MISTAFPATSTSSSARSTATAVKTSSFAGHSEVPLAATVISLQWDWGLVGHIPWPHFAYFGYRIARCWNAIIDKDTYPQGVDIYLFLACK